MMIIECECGEKRFVDDHFVGSQLRCTKCGRPVVVENADRADSSDDDSVVPERRADDRGRGGFSRPARNKAPHRNNRFPIALALGIGGLVLAVSAGVFVFLFVIRNGEQQLAKLEIQEAQDPKIKSTPIIPIKLVNENDRAKRQRDAASNEKRIIAKLKHPDQFLLRTIITAHDGCLNFSPDSRKLAVGNSDGTLTIWDLESGNAVKTTSREHSHEQDKGARWAVRSVAFKPDGKSLLSYGRDDRVCLWDANSGKLIHDWGDAGPPVTFSPDGSRVLTGKKLYDTHSGQVAFEFDQFGSGIWSPDGSIIARASNDRLELWDSRTLKLSKTIEPFKGLLVCFTPDGKKIAVREEGIRLVELPSGATKKLVSSKEHSAYISAVFTIDGKFLLTSNGDFRHFLEVWDVTSGKRRPTADAISRAGVIVRSPGGSLLATTRSTPDGFNEREIRIWAIPGLIRKALIPTKLTELPKLPPIPKQKLEPIKIKITPRPPTYEDKSVDDWVRALNDKSNLIRRRAAFALANLGVDAKAAIPALLAALRDADTRVRGQAAKAIGCIGTTEPVTIAAIAKNLDETAIPTRAGAIIALGFIGEPAKLYVPKITTALRDEHVLIRHSAAQALGRIGAAAESAVPSLTKTLDDKQPIVRAAAAFGLGGIGAKAKAAVPRILEALQDPDPIVRRAAIYSVGCIDPTDQKIITAVVGLVNDRDYRFAQYWVTYTLRKSGVDAMPPLLELLRNDPANSRNAIQALGKIGPAARGAVADLLQTLGHEYLGYWTGEALQGIGESAVPILIKALTHAKTSVRSEAAWALARVTPPPIEALPHLCVALRDNDKHVRFAACVGLQNIHPEITVKYLAAALKDEYHGVRAAAARALSHSGSEATYAVPGLIVALGDSNEFVRRDTCRALAACGPAAEKAIPKLISCLKDVEFEVREEAGKTLAQIGRASIPKLREALNNRSKDRYNQDAIAQAAIALGKIGNAAKPVLEMALNAADARVRSAAVQGFARMGSLGIPYLIRALQDRDPKVRVTAARRLASTQSITISALAPLVAALKDSNDKVRWHVCWALGNIGSEAEDAVVELVRVMKDESQFVRSASAKSLGRIKKKPQHAVPALLFALNDNDEFVRIQAVWSLGQFPSSANVTVPRLIALFKDPNLAFYAMDALADLGPDKAKAAIQPLVEMLKEREGDWRSALYTLGRFGPVAEMAVPFIQEVLREKSIRIDAANALWHIDPWQTESFDVLIRAIEKDNLKERRNITSLLRVLGPDAVDVMPFLKVTCLSAMIVETRTTAAYAIAASGRAKDAIPELIDAIDWIDILGNSSPSARKSIAIALGKIGSNEPQAITALSKLLRDRNKAVREAAAEALMRIDPDIAKKLGVHE